MAKYVNTHEKNKNQPPNTEETIMKAPIIVEKVHHHQVNEIQPIVNRDIDQTHIHKKVEHEKEVFVAQATVSGGDSQPNCHNSCNNPNCNCTGLTCPRRHQEHKKKSNILEKVKHFFEK